MRRTRGAWRLFAIVAALVATAGGAAPALGASPGPALSVNGAVPS